MRFTFEAIGVVHSPFAERDQAPRQSTARDARGVEGTIELARGRGFEHALSDLAGFDHVWILFVFHRNVEQERGWKPKVLPPRSARRRGLFATRSPHRPNPIGMSVVRLLSIEGLVLRVADLDLLDGTPVLDLKPYIPYADAVPHARQGWLDEEPDWEVRLSPLARRQLSWLRANGVELGLEKALALGPHRNPSRRIRSLRGGGRRMALKEWRIDFTVEGSVIEVAQIRSGYRAEQIPEHRVHRDFEAHFP